MVVARVNIPNELDRFIGSIRENKGFRSKNEALNFIIKEYERINGKLINDIVNVKGREEKNLKREEKQKTERGRKKLQQNHINEIKSVLNGE